MSAKRTFGAHQHGMSIVEDTTVHQHQNQYRSNIFYSLLRRSHRFHHLPRTLRYSRYTHSTGSKGNWATFSIVFNMIKGPLHKHFGKDMNRKITLLVPYKRQLQIYSAAFTVLRTKYSWTMADLPALLTVDSAIGSECVHAIIDLTIHGMQARDQGFLKDVTRMCVLATRGRESIWMVAASKDLDRYSGWKDAEETPSESAPEDAPEDAGFTADLLSIFHH